MASELDSGSADAGSAFARRLRAALVGFAVAVPSYVGGLFLGMGLVQELSGNSHDRGVEAAMTGAFFVGPVTALAGFVGGALVYARRARRLARS
jgi:hypothetical protein